MDTGSAVDIASVTSWLQTYKVFVEWVSVIILAITGAVVWAYTRATKQMVEEMVVQRKVSLRPVVVIHNLPDRRQYKAVNVGHGLAINVRLETERPKDTNPLSDYARRRFSLPKKDYLAPSGEAVFVVSGVGKPDWENDPSTCNQEECVLDHDVLYPEKEFPLRAVIFYEDVEGRRYFTVCRLSGKELSIEKIGEGEHS